MWYTLYFKLIQNGGTHIFRKHFSNNEIWHACGHVSTYGELDYNFKLYISDLNTKLMELPLKNILLIIRISLIYQIIIRLLYLDNFFR